MTTSTRYERFLASLFRHERERIERTVSETLASWPTVTNCRPLRAGLWEVRVHLPTRIARVLFVRKDGTFSIVSGLIKKDARQQERAIKHALSQIRRAAA